MYWKLSGNKRTEVWDFLFQPGPPAQTDLEYSRRRNLVFGVLNGYHDAPRESVLHFLRRLEHVHFLMAEPLTLENYKAQFNEEDPFDAEDTEELSDSETFDFESMPLPRVVGQARDALVEQLSLMNHKRSDPDVAAYAEQKLNELYANNMLEFRAPFYTLETAPSRGIDWRMPSGGQHPGRGGGGDEGDGGGGGGDGSQFAGKGTSETSSGEKASGGKGSGGKDSGGKGSGGKGSGGKRRTSGSPQYMETDPHCVGSRDSEMRDLDTGFPCSPPFSYVETRDWRSRDVLEGSAARVLEIGGGEYERHASEGVPVDVDIKSAAAPEEQESSPRTRVVQREEESQRWQSRKVLETGGSECERHALEGASVDTNSESAGAPGETHALQREEETQHWPAREDVKGLDGGALVIGTSEEVLHSRSVVATTREGVVKGGQWTFVQTPVLGDNEGEEEPAVEARVHGDEKGGEPVVDGGEVTVGIQTNPQRKDDDSSSTRCGEEQGGRASVLSTGRGMVLHEAIELRNDSAATELVSDSSVAEVQNDESSVEGGEVTVSIKMDPERKDHDSPSTR
ncbi:hypothetical protein CBR_g1169 [Chara braunii]|uniref:Uncharacterized protein n=1 Tax=Chara braunii TaxID=69332 RepID=A0A388KDA8_CHABU|nr:hypothetical protein CBR_g1169 [Chara braunii]|eukprot:GBG68048.1 hypothetical protein CBR_g1169 [Chara braunii]